MASASASFAQLQAQMKEGVQALQELQADVERIQRSRQQAVQQQHENEMVLKELEVLDEDARVFKLIGPALVRQEQPEAAANVRKRLDFIAAEVSRLDARAAALEEKAGKRQAALQQMQAEAQRLQAQAQQQQQQQGGGGGA